MKIYIDYDETTGAINGIHELYAGETDWLEEVEVDDGFDTLTYTDYKIVDHELVPITPDERIALYFNGTDPEQEAAIKQEQMNQQAALEEMQRTAFLSSLTDEQALMVPLLFEEWSAAKEYKLGERVYYNGTLYKVLQTHTSQDNWNPGSAASLFAKVLTGGSVIQEILEWVQPDSTNPYMKGDRVTCEGTIYESIIDYNVWSPAVFSAGWKVIDNE